MRAFRYRPLGRTLLAAAAFGLAMPASAQFVTDAPSQVSGISNAQTIWRTYPVFTVGETVGGYTPVGIFDGIGIGRVNNNTNRIVVNSELSDNVGYTYALANGTQLQGARIHYFDTDARTGRIRRVALAYTTVYDRFGAIVTDALQINEGEGPLIGFDRFCSGWSVVPGEYNYEDAIYFAGEETSNGQLVALDGRRGTAWVFPMAGRAAWESVTGLDTGNPDLVALAIGDDTGGAPLLLYVGQKDALGDGSFLDRNGLAMGQLYAWKADNGDLSPQQWNGTGTSRTGTFVAIEQFNASQAGQPGFDAAGYADEGTLRAQYLAEGAFQFSRPEEPATNPDDPTQIVFTSTGRESQYPADTWGDVLVADFDFSDVAVGNITADITILYDGDDAGAGQFPGPDFGLRSPDNLDWADDGFVYVQEDAATALFGDTSGREARIWQLDPATGDLVDVAVLKRGNDALPPDQTDSDSTSIGAWETSGILDVTSLYRAPAGVKVLVYDVQAHTVTDGRIAANNLVQGGQLAFLLGIPQGTRLAEVDTEGLSFLDALDALNAAAGVEAPPTFALGARPNPFNWSSTLTYAVPQASPVKIAVFDALGREVLVLVDGEVAAGTHEVVFDGTDLPSGVYLIRMTTPQGEQTQRVTLTK